MSDWALRSQQQVQQSNAQRRQLIVQQGQTIGQGIRDIGSALGGTSDDAVRRQQMALANQQNQRQQDLATAQLAREAIALEQAKANLANTEYLNSATVRTAQAERASLENEMLKKEMAYRTEELEIKREQLAQSREKMVHGMSPRDMNSWIARYHKTWDPSRRDWRDATPERVDAAKKWLKQNPMGAYGEAFNKKAIDLAGESVAYRGGSLVEKYGKLQRGEALEAWKETPEAKRIGDKELQTYISKMNQFESDPIGALSQGIDYDADGNPIEVPPHIQRKAKAHKEVENMVNQRVREYIASDKYKMDMLNLPEEEKVAKMANMRHLIRQRVMQDHKEGRFGMYGGTPAGQPGGGQGALGNHAVKEGDDVAKGFVDPPTFEDYVATDQPPPTDEEFAQIQGMDPKEITGIVEKGLFDYMNEDFLMKNSWETLDEREQGLIRNKMNTLFDMYLKRALQSDKFKEHLSQVPEEHRKQAIHNYIYGTYPANDWTKRKGGFIDSAAEFYFAQSFTRDYRAARKRMAERENKK